MNKDYDIEEIEIKVKKIKQSFRLYMNGVTAESLRKKGLNYKICWGVSLQHLQEMAIQYGKNQWIAEELWKSEVRECKILAILTYPIENFTRQVADKWLMNIDNQEMAEQLVFNILQHVSYSKELSYELLMKDNFIYQLCAFNLLCRLFMNSVKLKEDEIELYLKKSRSILLGENIILKHSVINSLVRFANFMPKYKEIVCNIIHA
jgi:hypothetical protein